MIASGTLIFPARRNRTVWSAIFLGHLIRSKLDRNFSVAASRPAFVPTSTSTIANERLNVNHAGQFAADSATIETFAAVRREIDSWRWAGIPFYVRAGKALPASAIEAVVELKQPRRLLFTGARPCVPDPSLIRFRGSGTTTGITMTVQVKMPGDARSPRPLDALAGASLAWDKIHVLQVIDARASPVR